MTLAESMQDGERGSATDQTQVTPEVLKIAAHSRSSAVAGAIAGIIRDGGVAEVQSIGAGATNQAVKAIAIARAYLRDEAIDLICTPMFINLVVDGAERTGLRLLVERSAKTMPEPRVREVGQTPAL